MKRVEVFQAQTPGQNVLAWCTMRDPEDGKGFEAIEFTDTIGNPVQVSAMPRDLGKHLFGYWEGPGPLDSIEAEEVDDRTVIGNAHGGVVGGDHYGVLSRG